jgi:hypothetical protein
MDKRLLRILDANYNRSKEALRVIEDVFRFITEDTNITKKIRRIRHELTALFLEKKIIRPMLVERDSEKDIGRKTDKLELKRNGIDSLVYANFQRAKESLRVTEEVFKILDKKYVHKIKNLRYNCYSLEKHVEQKRPDLFNIRH